jgi:hypothetical protein
LNYEQFDGQQTVGKFIPVSQVLEYRKNVESNNTPAKQNVRYPKNEMRRSLFSDMTFRHWQAGVQLGGSYIFTSSADAEQSLISVGVIPTSAVKDYYKKLRHGLQLGANIYYFFNYNFGNIGLGVKYRLFSFSSQLDVMAPNVSPSYLYYSLSENEKLYINYYGIASFAVQIWLDEGRRFQLAPDISLGYTTYRDEIRFGNQNVGSMNNMLTTGSTIGADAGISFYYYPLNYLSLNANIAYFSAIFRELTVSDKTQSQTVTLDKQHYENVSQLTYSIGVQFHF